MKALLANLVLAGLVLQVPLAAMVVAKRLWRSLPVFSAYSLTNFLSTLVLYTLGKFNVSPYLYFYLFWILEGMGVLLGFGIVYEVFRELFEPYAALRRLARVTFYWVLVGLVLLGCVVVYAQSSALTNPLSVAVGTTEEAARIVEVGLLVFLFAFSRAFGLHWRQNVFGIALGLGIFASVELAGVALHARAGPAAYQVFNVARVMSFDASLLIWLGYIMLPERVTNTAELPKRAQLEQWNHAMMELINQ
jgi:hypothetical protein